jgi:hypothetical protein
MPKLTAVQVLQRLQHRLEKRMETIQRVKLEGFHAWPVFRLGGTGCA